METVLLLVAFWLIVRLPSLVLYLLLWYVAIRAWQKLWQKHGPQRVKR